MYIYQLVSVHYKNALHERIVFQSKFLFFLDKELKYTNGNRVIIQQYQYPNECLQQLQFQNLDCR